MTSPKKYIGYLGIRRDAELTIGYIIDDHDAILAWANKGAEDRNKERQENIELINDENKTIAKEELSSIAKKYVQALSAYYPLIGLTGPYMEAVEQAIVSNDLGKFASENLEIINHLKDPEGKDANIYGFGSANISSIAEATKRISNIQLGKRMLPGAILLSLCASFDFQFADLIRFMLEEKGNRFDNSDKSITIKEILSMGTIEEIKSKIISDEIDGVMRASHAEQAKFVEKNFHIKIIDSYNRWPTFIELFERRNLLAHGNLIVNSHYIGNCNSAKHNISDTKVGQVLTINRIYLNRSVDLIIEYGLFLIVTLWRKHYPDTKNDAYTQLNQIAYEMIQERRFRLASNILDFAFNSPKNDMKEVTHKMIAINLANSYKKLKDNEKCLKVLDGMDWSASSDDFQICVASLKEDVNRVVDLVPRVAKSESVSMEAFREWPAFDWVRDNDLVAAKFLECFGEPLKLPKFSESIKNEDQDQSSTPEVDSDTTVH